MDKQQELLDAIEQDALIVTGGVRSLRMRYSSLSDQLELDEEHLAKMLQAVLELKVLLGVPSSLTRERRGT